MSGFSTSIDVADVTQFVADPSGEYLYLATSTGYVYKWDAATGTVVASAQVGTDLSSITISADGTMLVVGEANSVADQPTVFHEVSTGTLSSTTITVPVQTTYPGSSDEAYKYGVQTVALTSNDQLIYESSYALSGFGQLAYVYNLSQQYPTLSNFGISDTNSSYSTSADGRYVLITQFGESPSSIQLYDSKTGSFITSSVGIFGTVGAISSQAGLFAVDNPESIGSIASASLKIYDLHLNLVEDFGTSINPGYVSALAFAGGGDQLLVWDTSVAALRVYDTQSWTQVAQISMPVQDTPSSGDRWGDLQVGDNGNYLYVGGAMVAINLAAAGLTEISASSPSAALVEAGVTPAGAATAGVSTSMVTLTPAGGIAALTYALTGWTALGSGLYSETGTYGSVVLDTAHNTLTYTLNNNAAATLALGIGGTATDSFTVEVGDGRTNASDLISFSVTGTDIDPTLAGHSLLTVNSVPSVESGAALLAGSADVKGQALQVVSVGAATHGAVVLDASGNAVFTPTAGYVGAASYSYTVSDGHGGSATATVQVNVLTPASLAATAPSAGLVEAGVTTSGAATAGVTTATISLTPSGGDSPTYVLTGWTSEGSGLYSETGFYGAAVLDTVHNTLTYTLNDAAAATLALGVGVTASDSFTVRIADQFTTATTPISFSVTGTDIDPTASAHSLTTVYGNASIESGAALLAGAADIKNEPLQVTGVGDATHGSVMLDGQGNAVFTAEAGFLGVATYDYTVSDGHGGTATATVQVDVEHPTPAITNDFTGNVHADLLFASPTSGLTSIWDITGSGTSLAETPNAYVTQVDPSYQVQGSMDFNGDGLSDLVWRNTSTGVFSIWNSTGSGFTANAYTGSVDPSWAMAGFGDFSGDGKDDILWRNTASGAFSIWSSTGTSFTPNTYVNGGVDTTWHIQGIGDFNGDGKDDILWRNNAGAISEWDSTGSGFTENVYVNAGVDTTWHVAAVADFNGDGKDDILWRNNSGTITEWQSTGTGFTENTFVAQVDPSWTLVGAFDFNADGKADLLWRNSSTGVFTIWESTGTGFNENVLVDGSVSNAYQIITHHYDIV